MKLKMLLSIMFLTTIPVGADAFPEKGSAVVRGIKIVMTEVAKDGEFEIYPDERFRKVDANSMLRLQFETPLKPEEVESSPRWKSLVDLLKMVDDVAAKKEKLAVRAKELINSNAPFDQEFVAAADALNAEVVQILTSLTQVDSYTNEPIVTSGDLTELMRERSDDPYGVITQVLNAKRDELHGTASEFFEDVGRFEVVLRAYLIPQGGQRQALHIPGYDNLPQGDFRPVDPEAVLPSPEEVKRLNGELKASRTVASAMNEIREKGISIIDNIITIIPDLRDDIINFGQSIRSDLLDKLPANWQDVFSDSFLDELRNVQTPNNESGMLSNALKSIGNDINKIQSIVNNTEELAELLVSITEQGRTSMDRLNRIPQFTKPIVSDIDEIIGQLPEWEQRLDVIKVSSPIVLQATTHQIIQDNVALFNEDVIAIIQSAKMGLEEDFPQFSKAITYFSRFNQDSQGMLELGAEEPEPIPQPLDDLRTAEIDLRYAGIAVGDNVSVTFDIRPKTSNDPDEPAHPPSVTYKVEVTLAGWHRRLDSSVILSRSIRDDSDNGFSYDTCLSMELHKFKRPSSSWFWNSLDFGFGFHSAFLNQDKDENFEFGSGVNISIQDGLLRSGIGYNFSVDKGYWFVGIGLFNLMGRLGDVGRHML